MDWSVNGIPAHPLFVHAVVVLVPLAAIAAILAAVWPKAQAKLGIVMPLLVTAGAASSILAVEAGEWLEERVTETDLVEKHTEAADFVLPWVLTFTVIAWAFWFVSRLIAKAKAAEKTPSIPKVVVWLLAAGLVVTAVGSAAEVYVVGDAGAKAVWSDQTK